MSKEYIEALQKFLDEYLTLFQKLHTNQQEKMLLNPNSPYNILKNSLQRLKKYDDALSGERLTEFGSQLTVNGYTYGMEHKMYYAPEYVVKLYDKLRNVEDIYREVKDNG